jgi:ferrochelatase
MAEQVAAALAGIPAERRATTALVFTAHSIPAAMASTGPYEKQLAEACHLVAEQAGDCPWQLAYQSRSGPPNQAWLEPDLGQCLTQLGQDGRTTDVVLAPIGFLSEHMEVVYDLDVEAKATCKRLGLTMVRSGVVGTHPRFIGMIRELILERIEPNPVRLSLGTLGPSPDECPATCCWNWRS